MIKFSLRHTILTFLTSRVFLLVSMIVCYSTQLFSQTDSTSNVQDSLKQELKLGKNAIKSTVNYEGDTIILDAKNKKVFLYHNAIVTYEDMKLEGEFIEVNFETNEIHSVGLKDTTGIIVGKPIFTTDGKPFHADEMWYNFKTKQGISKGVVASEEGGIIRGEKILKDAEDNMYIRRATYTTCNAEHPHFWIQANKFKVIPEKQVISGPANLVISGIRTPIILPFGFFPLQQKRSKGLVVGSFDQQARWGYGLRDFGFYTPVNDNLDLLFSGDIYLRGSWGLSVKTNYKKRYAYSGHALLKFNRYLEGEKNTSEFQPLNNYRIEWEYRQDQRAKPGRNFSADVKFISQDQQKYASTEVDKIIATNANSSVAYSRSFANKKVFLTTNARIDQNLSTGDLDMELPALNINVQRLQPFRNLSGNKSKLKIVRNIGLTYSTAFRNNVRINQDSIFSENTRGRTIELNPAFLSSIRNGVKHTASFNTSFNVLKYLNVSPKASLTDFWYFKTQEKTWDSDSIVETDIKGFSRAAAYSAGFDLNTVIYGQKDFVKGRVRAIRHVMRPTVGMSWSPNYQEQQNSGYRFVQTDTAGTISPYSIYDNGIYRGPSGTGNGSVSFSLNNNLEMKLLTPKDTSNGGVKKIKLIESFNLAGGYNFFADSFQLSPLSINAFTTLFNKLRVNFTTALNPYESTFDSVSQNYRAVDTYAITNGKIGQVTSRTLQLSTSLNPQALKRRSNTDAGEFVTGQDYFMDFSIPWDLSLNYSSSYNRLLGRDKSDATRDQTIMFNGNLKLTEYWKIGFRSGYNFTRQEPSITSIDFARDLHCWVFNFHWIPVGTYRQFNFELKVKAAMLKDLKLRKRDVWQNPDI